MTAKMLPFVETLPKPESALVEVRIWTARAIDEGGVLMMELEVSHNHRWDERGFVRVDIANWNTIPQTTPFLVRERDVTWDLSPAADY